MNTNEYQAGEKNRHYNLIICLVLSALTFCVYYNVLSADFISIDDPIYVTGNPYITNGVTAEGIRWALDFGHENGPYWMPLTMLSHMIDCQFFGLDPSKHHLTSLLIHILNLFLVFWFFLKITGSRWKSALIAAFFALHPLNVESVAWITSRKNVLNTFFWMTTLLLYLRYLNKKEPGTFLLVLLSFLCGLMTKPAIITLVFSLLLLDMWPLNRFLLFRKSEGTISVRFVTKENLLPLIEKVPFFVLTGILLFMNFSMDNFSSEATGLGEVPVDLRLANALVTYFVYIWKLILPFNLSVFYPYPTSIPLWQTAGALGLFVGISVFSIIFIKKHPWLFTGWFWFTGNLVMVSGLIQGGYWPAYADRFVYIPQLGFFILVVWGGEALVAGISERKRRSVLITVPIAFILLFSIQTWRQVGYWKNGITLYSHALDVKPDDVVSKVNLAFALDKAGETGRAIRYYKEVIGLYPDYWQAHSNLGIILVNRGDTEKALFHFQEAVRIFPDAEAALYNAALIHESRQRPERALKYYLRVADLNPTNFEAIYSSARILEEEKSYTKALKYYRLASQLKPDDAGLIERIEIVTRADELVNIALEKIRKELKADPENPSLHVKAGNIYRILELFDDAESYFRKALSLSPNHPKALSGLAQIYIDKKEYDAAAEIYKQLLRQTAKYRLSLYYNLACVYSLKNDSSEALLWLKKAVDGGFRRWDIIIAEKQFDNIRETDYFKQIKKKAENATGP